LNWLDRMKPVTLDPRDTDLSDTTYLVPCFNDLGPLLTSIERVGILNPPIIQKRSDGGMIPILGRRRLEAACRLSLRDVAARMVSDDMPASDGFALAFWDNYGHRGFDEAARAVVLGRLLELLPRLTVASDFLPALDIPPKGPRIERLKAIGRLEHRVLRALASCRIHEKTAALLTKCLPEDRSAVMDLVELLALNANKNAEVIANLFDLSVFSGRNIAEILQDDPLPAVLCDENLSMIERGKRIREQIRTWKFPALSDNEQKFHEWRRSLSLPPNTTIRHAQAFESEDCTVEIKLRSREDAVKVLERVSDLKR
jgi:hypothetical protein